MTTRKSVSTTRSVPDLPVAWRPALARVASGGCFLVLGAVDTGKTTLCAALAKAAFGAGRKTAVVDGDIGQSDIGPPATVGLAFVRADFDRLDQLEADALSFVGSCTLERHLLQTVVGVGKMVGKARARGAETILVDTTGLVSGGFGRALKQAKIDLVDPDCLVALQREDELEPLLASYRFRERPAVLRLPVSCAVVARNREERAERRRRRFAEYLAKAKPMKLSWSEVAFQGSAPGGNVRASAFDNLLVGLLDGKGETLALGTITGMHPEKREVEILAPVSDERRVKALALGSLRVSPEGVELGNLSPGELP